MLRGPAEGFNQRKKPEVENLVALSLNKKKRAIGKEDDGRNFPGEGEGVDGQVDASSCFFNP